MPAKARKGDPHSHGGTIIEGSPDHTTNGIPTARLNDKAICPIHGIQVISSASTTVSVNGRGQARVGDSISCGATISSGSPDTFAG